MKRLISGLPLFFTAVTLLAQDASPDAATTPVELTEAQAAGLMAAICGMGVIPMRHQRSASGFGPRSG